MSHDTKGNLKGSHEVPECNLAILGLALITGVKNKPVRKKLNAEECYYFTKTIEERMTMLLISLCRGADWEQVPHVYNLQITF